MSERVARPAGGLEESVSEDMVRAAFIPFGELTDINMPMDAASQKHRGFCFVQYEEKVRRRHECLRRPRVRT